MSIATVSVTVPPTGDGPIANISALVGAKTVTLSGLFEGAYILLASHDDATFDPVLTFNSNGRESVRLTLPDAYKSVRVRTTANTVPSSTVTMEIAGISTPGQNLFAVLATFLPGAGGTSAVVDTAALFPPTGLESGINIMAVGALVGSALVEGSNDGVGFNPIGVFQAGERQRSLLGELSPVLEFTPLSTNDNTRYLRITVSGQVDSALTFTIGGCISIGSSPGGVVIPAVISDDATTYQGLGVVLSVTLIPDTVNLGANNTVNADHSFLIGTLSSIATGALGSFAAGTNVHVGSPYGNIIGCNDTIGAGADDSNIIGHANGIGDGSYSSTILGAGNSILPNNPRSVNVGSANTVDANQTVCIGSGSNVLKGANFTVLLGTGGTVGAGSTGAVGIGLSVNIDASNTDVVVIGTSSSAHGTAGSVSAVLVGSHNNSTGGQAALFGTTLTNSGSDVVLLAGSNSSIDVGSTGTVVLGTNLVIGKTCVTSVVIGANFILPDSSTNSTVVGAGSSLGAASPYCVLLGTASVGATSPSSVAVNGTIGDNATRSISLLGTIGAPAGIAAHENFCYGYTSAILDGSFQCVLIGGGNGLGSVIENSCEGSVLLGAGNAIRATSGGAVLIGLVSSIINSANSVAIGRGNIIDATGTLAGTVTLVGSDNRLHGDLHAMTNMSVFGSSNDSTGVLGTVILGNSNVLADGITSVVVGIHNTINTGTAPSEAVLLGKDLVVSTMQSVTIGVGGANSGDRSIVVGYQATIGALAADSIAIGSGATVAANRAGSQAYGAGATANSPNQVVFGSVATPVLQFYAQTNVATNAPLFVFDYSLIVGNHDTDFKLLYKNALGNLVIQQVTVNSATGALTVPP